MQIYLLSFGLFALAFAGLALGVIAGRASLRGSCGGLGNADGSRSDCELCGRQRSRCPRRKSKTASTAEEQEGANHE